MRQLYPRTIQMAKYHIDFSRDLPGFGNFDGSGIPMVFYGDTGRLEYNPVTAIQYGIANLEQYHLTGKKVHMDACEKIFRRLAGIKKDGLLPYDFHYKRYSLLPPWNSAMAEGQFMSFSVMLAEARGSSAYMDEALATFRALRSLGPAKGIIRDISGSMFFEEYPSPEPSLVLNGHIFCLFGLYDLYRATGSAEARSAYLSGWKAMELLRPRYRYLFIWTKYDLYGGGRPASIFYHRLNLQLLKKAAVLADKLSYD